MYVYIYIHILIHLHMYMQMHMHMHMHTHTHIQKHIHTHKQIQPHTYPHPDIHERPNKGTQNLRASETRTQRETGKSSPDDLDDRGSKISIYSDSKVPTEEAL